jgi:SPP1 family predicted phage head-tail adaptor
MLSNNDLDEMRRCIALLLPQLCNIMAVTYVSDGQGGLTETWAVQTANVKCRVDWKSGKELITGQALQPYQSAVISMPYDTVVTAANRIAVGSSTFSIQSVNADQGWKAVTRCYVELIP